MAFYIIAGIVVTMSCVLFGFDKNLEDIKIYFLDWRNWRDMILCTLLWPLAIVQLLALQFEERK